MVGSEYDNFKRQLDEHYKWPANYTFKFVVPKHRVDEVLGAVGKSANKLVPSKSGKYVSVNFKLLMNSADDVATVYDSVKHIEGVMAL